MLTSMLSLALVLGTLAALLWWLRRIAGRRPTLAHGGRGPGRRLRVLETVELAPGRCLHLVELGGRGLVIASTAQSCELVCELEAVPVEQPSSEGDFSRFGGLLARLRKT